MKYIILILIVITPLILKYILDYEPKNYHDYNSLKPIEKLLMIIKLIVIIGIILFIFIRLLITLFNSQMIAIIIILTSVTLFLIINFLISYLKERSAIKSLGLNYDYIRKIPSNLSVCEISFLNNKHLNLQREFKATLLKLEQKDAITIENKNNKINFYKTEKKVKLKRSEKYIYDYIFSDKKQNFSFKGWMSEIKKEILEDGIIEDKKNNEITKTYFLSTSFIFFCFIIIFFIKFNDEFLYYGDSIIIGFLFSFMLLLPIYIYEKRIGTLNFKLTKTGWFF